MAYRRRYLSGQAATTVVIAEGAITSDKIVDGAVTHPKIAPGAVDSEHVVDSSLKSEDIKDGEIKTVDIASGAITTDKIASQAVTVEKLESSIQGIARPLTPGVSTEEIANDAVTKAKLAPNSVGYVEIMSGSVGPTELQVDACEESRIKDGAISRAKIAGSAIDSTKIATNAVTGSEILNRSVGNLEIGLEGCHRENIKDLAINTSKLADDVVSSAKLKSDSVTPDKIPDDSLLATKIHIPNLTLNKDKEMNRFFDDFMGASLSPEWVHTGKAGASVIPAERSAFVVESGAVVGDDSRIDWGGNLGVGSLELTFPRFIANILTRSHTGNLTTLIGLRNDADNYVAFYAHEPAGSPAIWHCHCNKAGNLSDVNTAIPLAFSRQVLEISYESPTSVYFSINGVNVAHIEVGASIPSVKTEPYLEIITREGVLKSFFIDAVSVIQFRE